MGALQYPFNAGLNAFFVQFIPEKLGTVVKISGKTEYGPKAATLK